MFGMLKTWLGLDSTGTGKAVRQRLGVEAFEDRLTPATVNLSAFAFANNGIADVVRMTTTDTAVRVDVDGYGRVFTGSLNDALVINGSNDGEEFHVTAALARGVVVSGGGGVNRLHTSAPSRFETNGEPLGILVNADVVQYGWAGTGNSPYQVRGTAMTAFTVNGGSGGDTIWPAFGARTSGSTAAKAMTRSAPAVWAAWASPPSASTARAAPTASRWTTPADRRTPDTPSPVAGSSGGAVTGT
jgi:hypothetical protein